MVSRSKLLRSFHRLVRNYMRESGITSYDIAEKEVIENYVMWRNNPYVGDDLMIREEIGELFI